MAYRKSTKNQTFTVVYQEVAQHKTMTMEARGLLLFMLSLPDDWAFHKQWLQDQCPGWGRERLSRVIKELEKTGYITRTAKRSEDGKKLAGWDWEVLAESALTPDLRETRQSGLEVRQTRSESDLRVSSQSGFQSVCFSTATNKTVLQSKQVSESTARARVFSVDQSENFADRVMSELLTSNLPERKHRYAQLKIKEFQERFPESVSVADCYSYVEQAVTHQINLTGH